MKSSAPREDTSEGDGDARKEPAQQPEGANLRGVYSMETASAIREYQLQQGGLPSVAAAAAPQEEPQLEDPQQQLLLRQLMLQQQQQQQQQQIPPSNPWPANFMALNQRRDRESLESQISQFLEKQPSSSLPSGGAQQRAFDNSTNPLNGLLGSGGSLNPGLVDPSSLSQLYGSSLLRGLGSTTAASTDTSSAVDLIAKRQQMLDEMALAQTALLRHQQMTGLLPSSPPGNPNVPSPSLSRKRNISGGSSGSAAAAAASARAEKTSAKKGKKNNKDKPKRPLSAYNLFFRDEREFMLNELSGAAEGDEGKQAQGDDSDHNDKKPSPSTKNTNSKNPSSRGKPPGKLGFEQMAKVIGKKWKEIDPGHLEYYQKQADLDKQRYQAEMKLWNQRQQDALTQQRDMLESSLDQRTKEAYFGKLNAHAKKSDADDE